MNSIFKIGVANNAEKTEKPYAFFLGQYLVPSFKLEKKWWGHLKPIFEIDHHSIFAQPMGVM